MKDSTYINIAKIIALESECVSLQVGAILVNDGCIISSGYNSTVDGECSCKESMEKGEFEFSKHTPWSDAHEVHAEMNAILNAGRRGISTDGATLYCTHEPCDQCLKNIIQAGIKRVVYVHPYRKERCMSKYRTEGILKIEEISSCEE